MKRLRSIAAMISFVAFLGAAGPTSGPPPDTDAYVARAMAAFGVPGLALTIVDGPTVIAKGYGVRELGKSAAVDERTLFPIGSESKAFTAAALAILVDEGKLHWDDKVSEKLPGFQMYDPYATANMTVLDLLTHRSGLGLGEGDLMFVPSTLRSRADVVHALRYLKPVTGFREQFAYDNVLYVVAGALVQAVSGERWEDFVQQHIFEIAGFQDALPNFTLGLPNGVALHAKTGSAIRGVGAQRVLPTALDTSVIAPAGGIAMSARDMGRWINVWLNHGAASDGRRVFSEQSARTLWKPVVVIPVGAGTGPLAPAAPQLADYALGWMVESYHGYTIVHHSGGVLGGIAELWIVPEKHLGISVLINSEDYLAAQAVVLHLLDHYLNLPQEDWIARSVRARNELVSGAEAALRSGRAMPPNDSHSLPIAAYAGTYVSPWYGRVTVTNKTNGGLWISFTMTPGMDGPLEHVANDTFRTRFEGANMEDAYVTFHVSGNNVDLVTLKAISPLADFSYDYQDLRLAPVSK
jgi:CubicO group peptidase (beta-lactamase class C family)